ncbi:hypothetical protein A2U01_0096890, partial [Trifolium medium]|nr:hypothetical protein [Trifolium medium]
MVTTKEDLNCGEEWYLDSGCSTHMTERRDWFSSFNQSHKNKVKFAINDVLYIP